VEDQRHPVDVDAASRDVRGHERVHMAAAERLERPFPLRLRAVTVNRGGADAGRLEPVSQPLGAVARAAEHDGVAVRAHQIGGGADLGDLVDGPEVVEHVTRGLGLGGELVAHRRLLVAADQRVDVAIQRGRPEHGLAAAGCQVEQAAHLREEAHVGQPISLVHHGDLDGAEVDLALVDQVLQTARTRHDDVDATAQGLDLHTHRGAAIDGEHPEAPRLGDGEQSVLHLARQLAGGHQHQASGSMRSRLLDASDEGDAKGECLAAAGWRAAAEVGAGETVGQGGRLHGERRLDAAAHEGAAKVVGHAEGAERGHREISGSSVRTKGTGRSG